MNTIAYKNMLESNWDEIKGELQKKWGDLTDNDMKKIDGSYNKLTAKLKKLYGSTALEIEEEIAEFFDDNKFSSMKKAAFKKVGEIKDVVSTFLQENYQAAKKKTYEAEQAAVEYVKENPYKVIGVAALAGLIFSYLAKPKR